jgi:hypothetical protein
LLVAQWQVGEKSRVTRTARSGAGSSFNDSV